MDPDDEICNKSCRMYCRNRWNFGRPKFCDAKRIEDALNGLHGDELFNMAIRLMWEKSSYVREVLQYDYNTQSMMGRNTQDEPLTVCRTNNDREARFSR